MVYSYLLLSRKLMLPMLAALLGASLYAGQSEMFVENHTCRTFHGAMMGNDPTLVGTLNICRDGFELTGTVESDGQSGYSKAVFKGEMLCDGSITLTDTGPAEVRAMEGWKFCFDDTFTLRWDGKRQTLSGNYDSEECNDHGSVLMKPMR